MSKSMKKDNISQILLNIVMLMFFGVLFVTGTFFDEAVARTVFSPGNTVIAVITSTGLIPYFTAPMLFSGALYERAVHSSQGKAVKVILCTVCVLFTLGVGFIGGGAICDRNCFGMLFPSINRNNPVILLVSAVLEYPLFFVGYHFAKKSEDKLLTQKIICLFIILLTAFLAMQVLKHTFHRPRYRTVVLGYEGIGFMPWYTPFEGSEELAALYDINADEFLSFPSGHSILSVSAMYILPSFMWLFPKLKGRYSILALSGAVFGIIIMTTRMILGAHYLSDVSMGAIIAAVLGLVNTIIQQRISAKEALANS